MTEPDISVVLSTCGPPSVPASMHRIVDGEESVPIEVVIACFELTANKILGYGDPLSGWIEPDSVDLCLDILSEIEAYVACCCLG